MRVSPGHEPLGRFGLVGSSPRPSGSGLRMVKEVKEVNEAKEANEANEAKEAREARDAREVKEAVPGGRACWIAPGPCGCAGSGRRMGSRYLDTGDTQAQTIYL